MGKIVRIYSPREERFVYVELTGNPPYVNVTFAGRRTNKNMGFCWKHGWFKQSKGYQHGQRQRCPKCEREADLIVEKK